MALRIVAFSDWRSQPLEHAQLGVAHVQPAPDLILYGGDDVVRFGMPHFSDALHAEPVVAKPWTLDRITPPHVGWFEPLFVGGHPDFHSICISVEAPERAHALRMMNRLLASALRRLRAAGSDHEGQLLRLREAVGRARTPREALATIRKMFASTFVQRGERWLAVFHRPRGASGTNEFSRLARHTTYGVHGVIGNDCTPEHRSLLMAPGVRDLHRNPFVLNGIGFIGLEGSPGPLGIVTYSEDEALAHLDASAAKLPPRIPLVVVSHAPPRGILDLSVRFGLDHIGSRAVRRFMKTHNVRLVLCGHAHLSGGCVQRVGRCTVVNTANHDGSNDAGRLAVVDVSRRSVEVQWVVPRNLTTDALLHCSRPYRNRLAAAGIRTLDHVAGTDEWTISEVAGVRWKTAAKWVSHAEAQKQNRFIKRRPFPALPQRLVFYDIETLPFGIDRMASDVMRRASGDEIWLIGALRPGERKVTQFLAERLADERRILQRFVEWLRDEPGATLVSYNGSKFDDRRVRRRLANYSRRLLAAFDKIPKLDLLELLRTSVIPPSPRFNLRELSAALGIRRRHDLDSGTVSFMYVEHLAGKKTSLRKLAQHNEDDVLALPRILARVRADLDRAPLLFGPPGAPP